MDEQEKSLWIERLGLEHLVEGMDDIEIVILSYPELLFSNAWQYLEQIMSIEMIEPLESSLHDFLDTARTLRRGIYE